MSTASLCERNADSFASILGTGRRAFPVRKRPSVCTVRNANGSSFNLRVIEIGGKYGHDARNDSGQRMVEVYDAQYANVSNFSPYGQVVGSWNISTLLESDTLHRGWMLHGGVPKWTLDAEACAQALAFLRTA